MAGTKFKVGDRVWAENGRVTGIVIATDYKDIRDVGEATVKVRINNDDEDELWYYPRYLKLIKRPDKKSKAKKGDRVPLLNKQEYIALELTKAWAGQMGGVAFFSDKVVDMYKSILSRLYLDTSESN